LVMEKRLLRGAIIVQVYISIKQRCRIYRYVFPSFRLGVYTLHCEERQENLCEEVFPAIIVKAICTALNP
jgi:hypothetical protein